MSPSDAGDADRSGRDGRDGDEELAVLIDQLEATLSELRSDLRTGRDGRGSSGGPAARRGSDRRPPRPFRSRTETGLPRPPSPGEFLRFTEQYTLPTLVSLLEATIQTLELLRGTLRLVDPDRSVYDSPTERRNPSSLSRLSGGVAGVGREAVSGVERALSELETALSETDIPEDRTSNELLEDVRDLSAEISERLDEARQATEADRYGYRREHPVDADRSPQSESSAETTGVAIDVEGSDDGANATDSNDTEATNRPEVDVEAELESIRHEVRGDDADGVDGEADEPRQTGEISEDDGPAVTGDDGPERTSEDDDPDGPSDDDPDEAERPDRRTD